MNEIRKITKKYAERIGSNEERVSFMHSAEATAAARELAAITESTYIGKSDYNVIWRIGQVLGDARYFAAVQHEADGVYSFIPARLS